MNNMEIYNKYKAVPSNALRPFDNGKFRGTDINTMWRIKCLTEQFGPIGLGWTMRVLRTWTEEVANNEVMAHAEIELKVKYGDQWSEPFTAVGGNMMISYIKKDDRLKNNDECYKMAVTDAFGVACKYLGLGADVYWDNDKTKYTQYYDEPTGAQNLKETPTDEKIPAEKIKGAKTSQETPHTVLDEYFTKAALLDDNDLKNRLGMAILTDIDGRPLGDWYKNKDRQFILDYYNSEDADPKEKWSIAVIEESIRRKQAKK